MAYFESVINGGFLYAGNPAMTLVTNGCKWNHLRAGNIGGFMYGNVASMDMSNCDLTNITAGAGGSFMQTTLNTFDFKLSTCNVNCNPTPNPAAIAASITSNTPNTGSFFDIASASSVTSISNTY